MSRTKLIAAAEAAPGSDWASLSNRDKSALVREYPGAVFGTERDMRDEAVRQDPTLKTYDQLTGQELNELRRVRAAMRAAYEREVGPLPVAPPR